MSLFDLKKCPCALPDKIVIRDGKEHNLKTLRHDDFIWPMSRIYRSQTSRGPRCKGKECECGGVGYKKWPPKLIEGHNVTRWEKDGSTSVIEIPSLRNRTVKADDVYGWRYRAIERQPGHPNFGNIGYVEINWEEGMGIMNQYHPSTIQKFCGKGESGWMKLDPWFQAKWKMIKKREVPGMTKDETGEDTVLFSRIGTRADSLDLYYSTYTIYGGLHWN